jgi:16S rRNA (adenine1518-N6/adenine1519-N6)-dimethyltransferase
MSRVEDSQPRRKKRLGQVFLRHRGAILRVLKSADIAPSDTVVEIGGGDGRVTAELGAQAEHVITVEIDAEFVRVLRDRFSGDERVTVVHGDILAPATLSRLKELTGGIRPILYGSIPYYITSPIIRWALDHRRLFRRAALLVQKEVARRVASGPGGKEYGFISVLAQLQAGVRTGPVVSRRDFAPVPQVDSQLLLLDPNEARYESLPEGFIDMLGALFGQRRKQIGNTLRGFLGRDLPALLEQRLDEAGFSLKVRPEELSPRELYAVYEIVSRSG